MQIGNEFVNDPNSLVRWILILKYLVEHPINDIPKVSVLGRE